MFSQKDMDEIVARGSSVEKVEAQVERFKKGFPWMEIVAPATPERGIKVLDPAMAEEVEAYNEEAQVMGRCKFVPASGAASRMFKDIFSGLAKLEAGEDVASDSAVAKLAARIKDFAFYSEAMFGEPEDSPAYRRKVAARLLADEGLGYGSKPKGVLDFHRYPDGEVRTAFAEHLIEAKTYMRNSDGTASLVVTISPEHLELFEKALAKVKADYEEKYDIKYNIRFTYQDKATDTVAVDLENQPFRDAGGKLLFRPAGHGALIYNLNEVQDELVSIKNIDNVANERLLEDTEKYKKVLMGCALELRDCIYNCLDILDNFFPENGPVVVAAGCHNDEETHTCCHGEEHDGEEHHCCHNGEHEEGCCHGEGHENEEHHCCHGKGHEGEEHHCCGGGHGEGHHCCHKKEKIVAAIEQFLDDELCIKLPETQSLEEKVALLRKKLNRPIRVCGMVKQEGEPGGGPFIVKGKDGSTNLQILESVQINPENPRSVEILAKATHFNPVDIVCCLYDYKGNKFNLPDFVDEEAGFISSKSYQGRELKALELPGLWNGAMSDWNTSFIEVPLTTFNPVKVVLDLLRPAHQA